MLLLVDRDAVRDILADALSRSVEEFLAYIDPTITFQEISRALLIPLERWANFAAKKITLTRNSICVWLLCECSAYKLAMHLSRWGIARIVKTITAQSLYKVNSLISIRKYRIPISRNNNT